MKILLGDIQPISIKKLKSNPLNEKYFSQDNGHDFDDLYADIEKRGVLVPIVAKRDGTLLAGHRRLRICEMQGKKFIPGQYCMQDLSPEAELEFLLKDNVLRRHLTPEERVVLYRASVKNFDKRVDLGDSKHRVTARELAEKTGINQKTIGYDLSRIKHQKRLEACQKSAIDIANDKAIAQYKKSISRMLNVALVEKKSTAREFLNLTKMALKRLQDVIDLGSGK